MEDYKKVLYRLKKLGVPEPKENYSINIMNPNNRLFVFYTRDNTLGSSATMLVVGSTIKYSAYLNNKSAELNEKQFIQYLTTNNILNKWLDFLGL